MVITDPSPHYSGALTGDALTEIATKLNTRSEQYQDLYEWVNNPRSEVSSQFAATLFLYETVPNDAALRDRIINFWAEEPLGDVELRRFLREYGGSRLYDLTKISTNELALSAPTSPLSIGTVCILTASVKNLADPANPPLSNFPLSFHGVTDANGTLTFHYSGTKSGIDKIPVWHEGDDVFLDENHANVA